MVRFDAYVATTFRDVEELTALFPPELKIVRTRPMKAFGEAIGFQDETDHLVGSISWGGYQGERKGIEIKGERTPAIVEALRASIPHQVTRMDSCADFDAPGTFERLSEAILAIKREDKRIYGSKAGDWEDHPEKGRTLYIGSNTSDVKLRLYEKGLQPEYVHCNRPDWVRLELQVRLRKEAKQFGAHMDPMALWGSSLWSQKIAATILDTHVDPAGLRGARRKSNRERAIDAMLTQYGKHLVSLLEDLGNWEALGAFLGDRLAALQDEAIERKRASGTDARNAVRTTGRAAGSMRLEALLKDFEPIVFEDATKGFTGATLPAERCITDTQNDQEMDDSGFLFHSIHQMDATKGINRVLSDSRNFQKDDSSTDDETD